MSPDLIKPIAIAIFASLLIAAAVKDVISYTIPNWMSGALALAFAPAAFALHAPLGAVGLSCAFGMGALLLGVVMFALRWIGGGDAKLMAASTLWLGLAGLKGLAPFVVYTALAGGLLALVVVMLRSTWLQAWVSAGPAWAKRLVTPGEAIPYGAAIAAGALAAFARIQPFV
jgi:prepilin peptidase CpaA